MPSTAKCSTLTLVRLLSVSLSFLLHTTNDSERIVSLVATCLPHVASVILLFLSQVTTRPGPQLPSANL